MVKRCKNAYDKDGILRLTAGTATIFAGGHAPDARSCTLTGNKEDMLKKKKDLDLL